MNYWRKILYFPTASLIKNKNKHASGMKGCLGFVGYDWQWFSWLWHPRARCHPEHFLCYATCIASSTSPSSESTWLALLQFIPFTAPCYLFKLSYLWGLASEDAANGPVVLLMCVGGGLVMWRIQTSLWLWMGGAGGPQGLAVLMFKARWKLSALLLLTPMTS